MPDRPMDGTGTLRLRSPDGAPLEEYFGGANVSGGYWVQQVDAWPHGPLQAQLNRIEQKIDLIGMRLGLVSRGALREWYGLDEDG